MPQYILPHTKLMCHVSIGTYRMGHTDEYKVIFLDYGRIYIAVNIYIFIRMIRCRFALSADTNGPRFSLVSHVHVYRIGVSCILLLLLLMMMMMMRIISISASQTIITAATIVSINHLLRQKSAQVTIKHNTTYNKNCLHKN